MTIIDILLMVAVVQCADLTYFKTEELFDFWVNLSNCSADDDFFDEFNEKDQQSIKGCVALLENEFKRRGFKPVNLLQMMKDNPGNLYKIMKSFDLEKLLVLQSNLKSMKQTKLIKDFIALIEERIMAVVPVA